MAQISTQIIQLARSGVDQDIAMFRKDKPQIWPHLINKVDNYEEFMLFMSYSNFPTAVAVNQSTGIPMFQIQVPWTLQQNKVKRGAGFAYSFETGDRDVYQIVSQHKEMLSMSIIKAQEADIANFVNQATSGAVGFQTPDGVAYFSTGHLYAQGTFSNILSTQAALGPSSLTQALAELFTQPDHQGDPLQIMDSVDLWVHPYNYDLACRICHSSLYPLTPNNDPNVAGPRVRQIIQDAYFTSPTAWALVVNGTANPFVYINEDPGRTAMDYEARFDQYVTTHLALWGKAMRDARGAIYSPGL